MRDDIPHDDCDDGDPLSDWSPDRQGPPRDGADDRCDAMELFDGDVVFYDRENPDAWIQSSVAIDFSDLWSPGAA
jgi:hypothetical protein